MAKKARSSELKAAFTATSEKLRDVTRLEKIGKAMDIKLSGKTCKAMLGLLEEGSEVIKEDGDENVIDAALIGAVQRRALRDRRLWYRACDG